MNPLVSAVFLGVVEGLTEFLPVSSTGHLIVAERLIGYRDVGETFTIVIQLGAILAVVWFYLRELLDKLGALLRGQPQARRFWLNLVIASLPAAVVGLLFENAIKAVLFSPTTVALSLIVGGVILWVVEARRAQPTTVSVVDPQHTPEPDLYGVTPRQALTIGLAQAVAVIPGVSRSGASIVGGLLSGLDRVTATAFSFFMGIPVLGAAGLYSLYKARHTLGQIEGGAPALLVGTAVSFVTALLAVSWLLRYVSRHDFRSFAVYRVVFGAVILALVAAGALR
ncbi:undecaprenyl-diphosphate phosphatase [Deinococcus aestuarii]|uniref:undecaprenyl-diphosphate phosphatase n=1 Tax=Deinococcus aestuarii TaxID=2774531 RepID=UPI001C0AEB0E